MNRPIILDVSLRSRSPGPRLPRPSACPRCRGNDFVPIVHGFLSEEGMAEARAGKVAWGGCTLNLQGPTWCCNTCGHCWPKGGSWPNRLRWERYSRRPDVFLVITARKARWFFAELFAKFIEECIWIPLLIYREKPVVDERIALKEGGFRYMVRFQNEVVRVAPEYGSPDQLDAHCTSKKNYLAGTKESDRYQIVAMRLVFKEAPQYRVAMEAAEREFQERIKVGIHRRK